MRPLFYVNTEVQQVASARLSVYTLPRLGVLISFPLKSQTIFDNRFFRAAVVCADLNEQGAQETASLCIQKGGQAVGVACNVTDHAALVNIFDVALKKFGKLDVVCPCAGVASVDSNYAKGAPELLQRPAFLTLQINLIAVVDSVSIALHHWKKVQPSTPVNILLVGSMSSFIAFKSEPLYVAAKHGVLGLARALYLDYKTEQKIRVCMIAPWFVDTGIIPKIAKAAIAAVGFAEMEDVTSAMIAGATSVGDGQSYAIEYVLFLLHNILQDLPNLDFPVQHCWVGSA